MYGKAQVLPLRATTHAWELSIQVFPVLLMVRYFVIWSLIRPKVRIFLLMAKKMGKSKEQFSKFGFF